MPDKSSPNTKRNAKGIRRTDKPRRQEPQVIPPPSEMTKEMGDALSTWLKKGALVEATVAGITQTAVSVLLKPKVKGVLRRSDLDKLGVRVSTGQPVQVKVTNIVVLGGTPRQFRIELALLPRAVAARSPLELEVTVTNKHEAFLFALDKAGGTYFVHKKVLRPDGVWVRIEVGARLSVVPDRQGRKGTAISTAYATLIEAAPKKLAEKTTAKSADGAARNKPKQRR